MLTLEKKKKVKCNQSKVEDTEIRMEISEIMNSNREKTMKYSVGSPK